MNIGKAWTIFKNIDDSRFTPYEKGRAVQIVMDAATHNSITKDEMLRVIRWLWNMVFVEIVEIDEVRADGGNET